MTARVQPCEGIDRLVLFFASAPTRQGVLARQALGRPAPDDDTLGQRLIAELVGQSRVDGIAGPAVPMIWRAHELMDLGCTGEQEGCRRIMEWMLGLQGVPGAFHHGCSRTRHAHRICEHFISGFFAPAPPDQRLAPIMLPNGKVFRAEPAARFAISCLAFRAAVRGSLGARPQVERHLTSLLQLQEQWTTWNGYFAADAIIAGMHALAVALPTRTDLQARLSSTIAAHQLSSGAWPNADLFHTLEALLALGTPEALAAVRRAIPTLLARQRTDGSFGSTAQQERAWIALRALIWAEQNG
ncbi:MAG TPA: hypothetical protein VFH24_08170 [Gemmatimonadales bacterium]|nr:hypothetical protein [Gemmatimonadales bacterium]